MRKAQALLDAHGVAHRVHDVRTEGVPATRLDARVAERGLEQVLNRAGTTFRKLPADRKDLDAVRATALMRANPSAIKRPVLNHDGMIEIGPSATRPCPRSVRTPAASR